MHVGFQAFADLLLGTGSLEHAVDNGAHVGELLPVGHLLSGEGVGREGFVHLVEHHVARVVLAGVRHGEPDLVAGESEDRREELGKRVEREVQRGLRAAAGQAVRTVAVEAVLHDIEIEARERGDAEIVHRVGDDVELIVAVGLFGLFNELVELREEPAVELGHLLGLGQLFGVEVDKVVEHELAGVAELEVVLAELLEDLLRAADVRVIVRAGGPQTQNVRAVLVEHVRGIDAVAKALVHGLAFTVDRPAVGDALLKGRALAEGADSGQQ